MLSICLTCSHPEFDLWYCMDPVAPPGEFPEYCTRNKPEHCSLWSPTEHKRVAKQKNKSRYHSLLSIFCFVYLDMYGTC